MINHKKNNYYFNFRIFNASCSIFLTGTKQKVSIDSNPQGADIIIDGQQLGVTPSKVKVDRELDALLEGGKEIQLEMPGYSEYGYELDAEINPVAILNTVNLMFWGIDIATGALTKYDNYYNFELMLLEDNISSPNSNDMDDKYEKLIKLKYYLMMESLLRKNLKKKKLKS